MLCRCGHALDYRAPDGTRKVRTRMVLFRADATGAERIAIVCPECQEEVAVQIGGERRLVHGRTPVLYLTGPRADAR